LLGPFNYCEFEAKGKGRCDFLHSPELLPIERRNCGNVIFIKPETVQLFRTVRNLIMFFQMFGEIERYLPLKGGLLVQYTGAASSALHVNGQPLASDYSKRVCVADSTSVKGQSSNEITNEFAVKIPPAERLQCTWTNVFPTKTIQLHSSITDAEVKQWLEEGNLLQFVSQLYFDSASGQRLVQFSCHSFAAQAILLINEKRGTSSAAFSSFVIGRDDQRDDPSSHDPNLVGDF
jgi:hypothetical protein